MKNKHGWIEIVEAFVAVLLITGVILIVLNKGYSEKEDISNEVYDVELSILREIQLDEALRVEILEVSEPLPVGWDNQNFPPNVKSRISERTPEHLECIGKICDMTAVCNLEEDTITKEDIYAQSIGISPSTGSAQQVYRQINLFCWAK